MITADGEDPMEFYKKFWAQQQEGDASTKVDGKDSEATPADAKFVASSICPAPICPNIELR
jgi:hypothetical protein